MNTQTCWLYLPTLLSLLACHNSPFDALEALPAEESPGLARSVTLDAVVAYPRVSTVSKSGGRVDWSATRQELAFDRLGDDGFYDVWVRSLSTGAERCMTCGLPQVPKHNGNPAWHPSGKYLVFQAEKAVHRGSSFSSKPGLGARSDLWLQVVDTGALFQLTRMPDSDSSGVLHPHFSSDGGKLTWTEMVAPSRLFKRGQEAGFWKLKLADFSFRSELPTLDGARDFTPAGEGFYENHGLDPEGRFIVFSSNGATRGKASLLKRSDIWTYDLKSGVARRLTFADYNEHAQLSPDGRLIVWMSNRDSASGTDYWIMRADGSGKRRLTHFNVSGSPHDTGAPLICADGSWDPDGSRLAIYVQDSLLDQTGALLMLDLLRSAEP